MYCRKVIVVKNYKVLGECDVPFAARALVNECRVSEVWSYGGGNQHCWSERVV
jgi:hypothetical protein